MHNERAEIFTFNYDLVLENILAQSLNYPNHDFDPIYTIKTMDNRNTSFFNNDARDYWRKSIKLYKLHGSINWLYDLDFQNGVRIVSSHTLPEYRQGLQCLIVPPTMLKNFELKTKLLDFQWHVFKDDLTQASKLYIIGYSIPFTDVATRFVLQTQLNPECEIFIVTLKPMLDIEQGWYDLFALQNKSGNLHILESGFNEGSIKKIGLS